MKIFLQGCLQSILSVKENALFTLVTPDRPVIFDTVDSVLFSIDPVKRQNKKLQKSSSQQSDIFLLTSDLSQRQHSFIRARGADTAMWQPERRKRNKIVATVTWKQTNTRMQTTFFFQQYRATLAEEYFVHQFVLSSFFFFTLKVQLLFKYFTESRYKLLGIV